jgi:hypothetical protein
MRSEELGVRSGKRKTENGKTVNGKRPAGAKIK